MKNVWKKNLTSLCLALAAIWAIPASGSAQTDWHGLYAGGSVGGVLGRATADTQSSFSFIGYFDQASLPAIAFAGRQKLNSTAFTGGLDAGYNFQSERMVYGIETDYESMRLAGAQSVTRAYPCCATSTFTINQSYKTRWLFTARGRAGYTMGNLLVYATTGIAETKINYQEAFGDTFASASESGNSDSAKAGWVSGVGGEYHLLAEHWSIKGEYLYTDFGRTNTSSRNLVAFTPPQAIPANQFSHTMALHTHILRAGVNFHW